MNGGSEDEQPTARPARSAPAREGARLYLEGSAAAVIMVVLSASSGIVALAFSGDHHVALLAAAVAFVLAGIVLTVRLWRMTRAPSDPTGPSA